MSDFQIQRAGNIFLFHPQNDEAREHLEQHVAEDAQWWAGKLCVEHGCARPLAQALMDEGFKVE